MATPEIEGIPLQWHCLVEGRPPDGLGLFLPVDPDRLVEDLGDEEFLATDERIPYFATLWPSAICMAERVMAGPSLAGQRILDLGCGVGAVGLAAARREAQVTFLDWEPRALDIVALSLRALRLPDQERVAADWRTAPPLGSFDRLLAADVLYEPRNVDPVAQFLARHLRATGEAWLVDPSRKTALERFPAALRKHGLETRAQETLTPAGVRPVITLFRIGHVAPDDVRLAEHASRDGETT